MVFVLLYKHFNKLGRTSNGKYDARAHWNGLTDMIQSVRSSVRLSVKLSHFP